MPLEQSGNADNLSKMADRRRRRALEDEGEEKENAVKGRPSECVCLMIVTNLYSFIDSYMHLFAATL